MDSSTGNIDLSLLELFKIEAENHSRSLDSGIVDLEHQPSSERVEPLLRAAHSIKGASRIIGLDIACTLAHSMEDLLSALHQRKIELNSSDIDLLLAANDEFINVANVQSKDIFNYFVERKANIDILNTNLKNALNEKLSPSATNIISEQNTQNTIEYQIIIDDNNLVNDTIIQQSDSIYNNKTNEPVPEKKYLNNIDSSLFDLLKIELTNNSGVLANELTDILNSTSNQQLEVITRAAHSIKGACRIVGLKPIVELANSIEEIFLSVQQSKITLKQENIDLFLECNKIFFDVSAQTIDSLNAYINSKIDLINEYIEKLRSIQKPDNNQLDNNKKISVTDETINQVSNTTNSAITKKTVFGITNLEKPVAKIASTTPKEKEHDINPYKNQEQIDEATKPSDKQDESLVRVLSENLNKLMGFAGESLVEARSLNSFSVSLLKIKNGLTRVSSIKEKLFQELNTYDLPEVIIHKYKDSSKQLDIIRDNLLNHIESFEQFTRRLEILTDKLYYEAIKTRMEPFSEGLHGFPRLIRELEKSLGKKVDFIIQGKSTRVDRDILEKLKPPLNHLIRNAIDHGIEIPDERVKNGKLPEGKLMLEAHHRAGMLIINVKDDGKGINPETIKQKIIEKGYVTADMAENLSISELMEFLFLPGFSTAKSVTEISGRGVGLDVVFSMVHGVGGTIKADSIPGKGTTFTLQLPLTLSVIRGLIIDINEELYALPLSRIDYLFKATIDDILILEDRQYFVYADENIGIINANQLFKLNSQNKQDTTFHIVVISDRISKYGLVINRFIGERDLVVIPLDKRLGKIPNISAGAIMEDGHPILILDTDDLVRSIDNLLKFSKLDKIGFNEHSIITQKKRILVVDDSITVREVERKLLENHGYEVELAVDGMDGWNTLYNGKFDLVISDVDMPRMNGIDFVARIKNNSRFKNIPVMIVSYKDREEDRLKGLDAGANYYLTKGSFHDEGLINAVVDLIGES